MDFLAQYNFTGIIIGACTFLVIGFFHPIVIKAEYYCGTRCWWIFLLAGLLLAGLAVMVQDVLWSSLLSVTAFSSFWSILEVFEQQQRVKKGWFPRNPSRTYPWDNDSDKQ